MRLAKLAAEKTALNGCREDMSDVSFEIGNSSYSLKIFAGIVILAVVFGGRILIRRMVGGSELSMSVMDKAFWILIGCIAVLTVVSAIAQSKRPRISVSGKTLFFGERSWSSDEISHIRIGKLFERIEVYSKGKKILSFPWEMDNSEIFIAWTKKCGIPLVDRRMATDKNWGNSF